MKTFKYFTEAKMSRQHFQLFILKIGIGTSDKFGNISVTRIKFKNKNKVIFY